MRALPWNPVLLGPVPASATGLLCAVLANRVKQHFQRWAFTFFQMPKLRASFLKSLSLESECLASLKITFPIPLCLPVPNKKWGQRQGPFFSCQAESRAPLLRLSIPVMDCKAIAFDAYAEESRPVKKVSQ